jgi:hypothetical protein
MNILHEENIIKTIRYLEKHRETLSVNDLNSIMIHTLENENKIDYDINEHLEKLSYSSFSSVILLLFSLFTYTIVVVLHVFLFVL